MINLMTDSGTSTTSSTSVKRTSARRTIRVTIPSGWARTLLAGVTAAVLGWLITTAVVLGGFWTVADNPWFGSLSWEDAQNFGGDLWAMAFGSSLQVASIDVVTGVGAAADAAKGVTFGAVPLLLSVIALLLLRMFLMVGHGYSVHSLWFAIPSFVATVVVEVAVAAPHSNVKTVFIGAVIVALIATLWAVADHRRHTLRTAEAETDEHRGRSGQRFGAESRVSDARHVGEETYNETETSQTAKAADRWLAVTVSGVRDGLRQGRTALVGLLVASLAGLVAICLMRQEAIAGIQNILQAESGADQAFIWVFQALFGPNFMAWVASWLAGPGFFLGTDALHTPTSAPVVPIPAIPIFGAVPATAPGYRVIWLLIAVAVLVGCWNRWRHLRKTLMDQLFSGLVSVAFFAAVVFTWMQLSGLVLGSGRMSVLGPVGWQATMALTAEISVFSVLVTLALHPTSVAQMRKWTGFANSKLHEARDAELVTESVIPGVEPQVRPAPLAPGAPTEAIKQPHSEDLDTPDTNETDEPLISAPKEEDSGAGQNDDESSTDQKDDDFGGGSDGSQDDGGDLAQKTAVHAPNQPSGQDSTQEADTEQFILSDTTSEQVTESDPSDSDKDQRRS